MTSLKICRQSSTDIDASIKVPISLSTLPLSSVDARGTRLAGRTLIAGARGSLWKAGSYFSLNGQFHHMLRVALYPLRRT